MKISFKLLILSMFIVLVSKAQDTTKVLFIGNSFTYYNNMPQLFQDYATAANKPVYFAMHAPGGVSVGDISQGTSAHMNNPAVYSLINSMKWDYVIIQDNQGRFILDSAQFPSSSLVIKGHLMLMDSIIANNSCAKVLWFGGWAMKNGYPPYGNTGPESIKRILCNYRVLNDTAKEIVSPIGEAWIKAITNIPATNLWDTDDTHPSLAGSYLTAAVIFHTIYKYNPISIAYYAGLSQDVADSLKKYAYDVTNDSVFYTKYNLGGIYSPKVNLNGNKLSTNKHYKYYQWYYNGVRIPLANDSVYNASLNGSYYLLVKDTANCYQKSCAVYYLATAINDFNSNKKEVNVYPNPVMDNTIYFDFNSNLKQSITIELYDITGRKVYANSFNNKETLISIHPNLKQGLYIYKVYFEKDAKINTGKIEVW